tara:strand:- start:263 stop:649 length:387 start_codon:yes stop_codon:yes gene_type:complete
MKTKISLSIIGGFNLLQSLAMLFFADLILEKMQAVASTNPDVFRMCEVMHYGLSPALLIIGLILILCRNAELNTAKNILLGYIIGVFVLMYVFFGTLAQEPLFNFDWTHVIPDIAMLLLAIFGYLKAK